MIDIDDFKAYNDAFGHPAGDACLTLTAAIIKASCHRPGDAFARFGGEEFAIVAEDTDERGARHLAERIRTAVAVRDIAQGSGARWPILTVSIGICAVTEAAEMVVVDVLSRADQALYRAKQSGRNCIATAEESSGALRAALFAVQHPERVDRLVLSAYTYTGKGSPTLAKRALDLERLRANPRRLRDRAMIESIFLRDKPGTSEAGVAEAVAAAELVFGDEVPTGTYIDMVANLPIVEPSQLRMPVMMLTGAFDGISTMDDLRDFYEHLGSEDKQFVVLPATAHSLVWAKNRRLFWHWLHCFLTEPPYEPVTP
jgi:diguanylate cyclase (GGDEF)-like protein